MYNFVCFFFVSFMLYLDYFLKLLKAFVKSLFKIKNYYYFLNKMTFENLCNISWFKYFWLIISIQSLRTDNKNCYLYKWW